MRRMAATLALGSLLLLCASCGSREASADIAARTTVARTTSTVANVPTSITTSSSETAKTTPTSTAATDNDTAEPRGYIQGQTGYSTFESDYIGLGIKLVADWRFLPRESINELDGNPIDFLTNGSLRGIGIIDRFTEVWATSDEGDVIKIVLDENAASRPTLEARIAKAATELEGDNELGRVEATLTAVSCAGKMYPGIEAVAHKNGGTQYMCMFMTDLGDYTATVHIIKAGGDSFDRELAMLYAVA